MSSYKTGTCDEHSSGEKYLKIIIHQKEKGLSQVHILLVNTVTSINALCEKAICEKAVVTASNSCWMQTPSLNETLI